MEMKNKNVGDGRKKRKRRSWNSLRGKKKMCMYRQVLTNGDNPVIPCTRRTYITGHCRLLTNTDLYGYIDYFLIRIKDLIGFNSELGCLILTLGA